MKNQPSNDSPVAVPSGIGVWSGWALPIGFVIVAAGFMAFGRSTEIPLSPVRTVDREQLVVGPRRVAMTDPASIEIEGVSQTCNGCHQIFESASPAGTVPEFHTDVRLSHGLNNRCTNCHDASNRELLTLRDGATVPFEETPQLCSQCHGTVYRDWQRGTHGKTLGSWVTHSADQRRLSCNECHDPHSPKYDPMRPLPGPDTLRMGDQSPRPGHGHSEKKSPLQKWLDDRQPTGDPEHNSDGGHP